MEKHLKGSLSTIVLKLLDDNGRMYGYEITQKVKELTSGDIHITEGALYPILHKLEAEEVVDRVAELRAFAENLNLILNPKASF
jgi:PadR family transcriptional regulator PadR